MARDVVEYGATRFQATFIGGEASFNLDLGGCSASLITSAEINPKTAIHCSHVLHLNRDNGRTAGLGESLPANRCKDPNREQKTEPRRDPFQRWYRPLNTLAAALIWPCMLPLHSHLRSRAAPWQPRERLGSSAPP